MKITIDEDSCKKANLSISELLMILLIKTGAQLDSLLQSMKEKHMLVEEDSLLGKKFLVTQRWDDLSMGVLLSSDKEVPKKDRLEQLAKKLMQIFPEGKKEGTSQYWRGNMRDVTLKLQKFFKLYGNKYTDEQILNAAQRYVASHNGKYQFMRVLKYFIMKNDKKIDSDGAGYIEEVSDLAAYIENEQSDITLKDDWMNTLV